MKKMSGPVVFDTLILGGGIAGLAAADALPKSARVGIFEASRRTGGKIHTTENLEWGGEFFDSDQKASLQMARKHHVKLEDTKQGESDEVFVLPDGSVVSDEKFYKNPTIQALQKAIIADKKLIANEPDSERSNQINEMSLKEYFDELSARAGGRLDKTYVDALASTFESECGRGKEQASAYQYLKETASEAGGLVDSDCAYRIKGGTQRLTDKLTSDLAKKKGVDFQYSKSAASIEKVDPQQNNGARFKVTFADGTSALTKGVISAMPAYKLAEIRGLEALGFTADDVKLMKETQYTNTMKFTVPISRGQEVENSCVFSGPCQTWPNLKNNTVTFLVAVPESVRSAGELREIRNRCMEDYAKAQGKGSASDILDTTRVRSIGPDKIPCYCSPRKGQAKKLAALRDKVSEMAKQEGFGVAGSFFPGGESGGFGFMNCAVISGQEAAKGVAQSLELQQSIFKKIMTVITKPFSFLHFGRRGDSPDEPNGRAAVSSPSFSAQEREEGYFTGEALGAAPRPHTLPRSPGGPGQGPRQGPGR